MKDRGVSKEPGISWIQLKNKLHYCLMGKKNIMRLERSTWHWKTCIDALDTNFVLPDVEEEQKQAELIYHCEKLAIAYGILCMPNGTPIQIMKNLWIYDHSFTKFVSNFSHCKIIIRDGSIFHHLRDGLCSCGDYWWVQALNTFTFNQRVQELKCTTVGLFSFGLNITHLWS